MGLLQLIFGELPGTTPVVTEVQPEGMAEGMLVMSAILVNPIKDDRDPDHPANAAFRSICDADHTLCEIETLRQKS